LIIGISGGLASFLTILITNWEFQLSLKWLIFTIYVFLTITLFLVKLLVEMNIELNKKQSNTSGVVRYVSESSTLLVSKNDLLGHSAMVSIFYLDDSFEVELGKGYVKNIQENFIQVEILDISENFELNYKSVLGKIDSNDIITLQKLIVKSYITYTR